MKGEGTYCISGSFFSIETLKFRKFLFAFSLSSSLSFDFPLGKDEWILFLQDMRWREIWHLSSTFEHCWILPVTNSWTLFWYFITDTILYCSHFMQKFLKIVKRIVWKWDLSKFLFESFFYVLSWWLRAFLLQLRCLASLLIERFQIGWRYLW